MAGGAIQAGEARLTLVSRVIEPGLEALARQVPA
jgi:hypothetical protein